MAFGIALIVLMLMFFLELIAYRWIEAKVANQELDSNAPHTHSHFGNTDMYVNNNENEENGPIVGNGDEHTYSQNHSHSHHQSDNGLVDKPDIEPLHYGLDASSHHTHHHHQSDSFNDETMTHEQREEETEDEDGKLRMFSTNEKSFIDDSDIEKQSTVSESLAVYTAQVLNVFVLEFGIIFHSIFVGLTLSCSGDEFISLYIVVVFHQMFEGLGLGTRVACVDWPRTKRWTPWLLCLGYTFSTPIAIAIGIGVRNSYPPGSRRALITNGVFDSVSAGILIYTGLIELMAHEFLFSDEFKGPGGFKKMIWAYIVMCVGAGLMALLGRWA